MGSLRWHYRRDGGEGITMKTDIRQAIIETLARKNMSVNALAVQVHVSICAFLLFAILSATHNFQGYQVRCDNRWL